LQQVFLPSANPALARNFTPQKAQYCRITPPASSLSFKSTSRTANGQETTSSH